MIAWMLSDDSRVQARFSWRENVSGKAFCDGRRRLFLDRDSPGVLFVVCRASAAAALLQLVVPWKDQWRLLVREIGHRVRPPGYVLFLGAQTRPPALKAICLHAYPSVRVRLLLLQARQDRFAFVDAFGCN